MVGKPSCESQRSPLDISQKIKQITGFMHRLDEHVAVVFAHALLVAIALVIFGAPFYIAIHFIRKYW